MLGTLFAEGGLRTLFLLVFRGGLEGPAGAGILSPFSPHTLAAPGVHASYFVMSVALTVSGVFLPK
jgi:hypothetical protein